MNDIQKKANKMDKISFYTVFSDKIDDARCAKTISGIKRIIKDQYERVWKMPIENIEIDRSTRTAYITFEHPKYGMHEARANIDFHRITFED